MARASDLDRIADRCDRPAGEVVRLLILALDANGQQQLNRFAHCSKLTVRRLGRETADPATRSREAIPRGGFSL
jgi:hypothetical protein